MTAVADPSGSSSAPFQPSVSGTSGITTRDPRLDVFRGIAMFIILIAHTPSNFLTLWIPARFGWSDAAEIFVFCSGMASAVAFGRVFDSAGVAMGTARVAHRMWQVYWGHIGIFLVVAMVLAFIDQTGAFDRSYVSGLNLQRFFSDTGPALVGLLTLSYVPNFFDILPMYIVILAMMPAVVVLHRINPLLLLGVLSALWFVSQFGVLDLPAEPWSERGWFFNPFAWQVIFYTGFALMRGWIPAPPVRADLIMLAALVLIVSLPLAYFDIRNDVSEFQVIHEWLGPLRSKTEQGILRYVHFLSLAYLAWAAAGEGGHRLRQTGGRGLAAVRDGLLRVITKVGQQSLAVFLFSALMARMMGLMIDVWASDPDGRVINIPMVWLINLIGALSLVAVAYTVAWFKSQPWRARKATA